MTKINPNAMATIEAQIKAEQDLGLDIKFEDAMSQKINNVDFTNEKELDAFMADIDE